MSLRLRMSVPSQVAMIVLSWALPFGAFVLAGPFIGSGPLQVPLLVVALLAAIALSVRGVECGVDCRPDTITVRGWVRTTSIPANAVTGIDHARWAVAWRDADGHDRRTRVHAFARSRGGVDRHSRESLEQLAAWVGGR